MAVAVGSCCRKNAKVLVIWFSWVTELIRERIFGHTAAMQEMARSSISGKCCNHCLASPANITLYSQSRATRRKQVVPLDIPPLATFGPCVRAGELVFPSGMMAVGRDGLVPAADQASAFDGLGLAGQAQGVMLMSYVDAICKAVNVPIRNVVRAQYFLGDMRHFTGIAAAWSDRYGKTPHPFACVQVPAPLPATAAAAIADFWVYAG